jgi:hypothetical protein
MRKRQKGKDAKTDRSLDMSFPASDAPARGEATGPEAPKRPADRKAPVITRDQIEQARRAGRGTKQRTK